MTNCQVSTIMVVPHDGVHHDTLNVGVILYDPDRNVAYRKVTDNWAEVRRRTGFRYNAGRGEGVQGPYSVGDDYLENLARDQVRDSLVVTPPKTLMEFATHGEALEWAYASRVGVPPANGGEGAWLREAIAGAGFPGGCYREEHEFGLEGCACPVRFPNVFFEDGAPRAALFAASLSAPGSHAAIKERLCEIHAIRQWSGARPGFVMCAEEEERDVDKGGPGVRGVLDLVARWGVASVYRDGLGRELGRMRAAARAGPGQGGA